MRNDTYFSMLGCYGVAPPSGHIISVPVQIGVETLPEELKLCLHTVSKGNFVSYKNISVVEPMIYMLMEKLQVYYQYYPDEARLAAEEMMRILWASDTDDDFFPSGQIATIQSIIHAV